MTQLMNFAGSSKVKKTLAIALVIACVFAVACPMVLAGDNDKETTGVATSTADKAMSTIVNFVFRIFGYIGAVLGVWGIGSLILAFKNEDADAKSRAIMILGAAILLLSLKTVIQGSGILTGTGIDLTTK